MTPQELLDGWNAGKRRVVLKPYEDYGAEPGELLGSDSPEGISDAEIVAENAWVVCVDRAHRPPGDRDGLRGGVPADQVDWEGA